MLLLVTFLGYLLHFAFFGAIGALIAKADRWPPIYGILIAGLIPFLGIAFLLGVWLAEHFVAMVGGRQT